MEFHNSHEFSRTNPIHIAGFSSIEKQFVDIGLKSVLGFLHRVSVVDGTNIAEVCTASI
jgi:hypothetical protein